MAGSASTLWSDGAKLASTSGGAVARQTICDGDDDAECCRIVVGNAAECAMDSSGVLCGGRDLVMEPAKSVTSTRMNE